MKFIIILNTFLIPLLLTWDNVYTSPIPDQYPTEIVVKNGNHTSNDDYDYNYEDQEFDNLNSGQECEEGRFWDYIGQQCVPVNCQFGRIPETGQCITFPSFHGNVVSVQTKHTYTNRYRWRNPRNGSSRYNVVRRPGGRG